jgi:hypothetical protein
MWLKIEQFIRASFSSIRTIAVVLGTVQGAIVLGGLWWLAGTRYEVDPQSPNIDIVLYSKFGVSYPDESLVGATVLGGLLGLLLGWLMSNEDKGKGPRQTIMHR